MGNVVVILKRKKSGIKKVLLHQFRPALKECTATPVDYTHNATE